MKTNTQIESQRGTFHEALDALEAGKPVARTGWNGSGMMAFKQVPSKIEPDIVPKMTSLSDEVKLELMIRKQGPSYRNQLALLQRDGTVDSWVPSVSDLFAKDWVVIATAVPEKPEPDYSQLIQDEFNRRFPGGLGEMLQGPDLCLEDVQGEDDAVAAASVLGRLMTAKAMPKQVLAINLTKKGTGLYAVFANIK